MLDELSPHLATKSNICRILLPVKAGLNVARIFRHFSPFIKNKLWAKIIRLIIDKKQMIFKMVKVFDCQLFDEIQIAPQINRLQKIE